MTFKELRPEIQEIAAHALRHHVESGYYEDGKTVAVAKDIKAAFVELFSDNETAAESISNTVVFHITAHPEVKKTTPHEFWASIKTAATTSLAHMQFNQLSEQSCQTGLHEEVSTLSSLVQELTGCRLFPSSGSEQSTSCTLCTGTDKRHQNHQCQMDIHALVRGDRQNTQVSN